MQATWSQDTTTPANCSVTVASHSGSSFSRARLRSRPAARPTTCSATLVQPLPDTELAGVGSYRVKPGAGPLTAAGAVELVQGDACAQGAALQPLPLAAWDRTPADLPGSRSLGLGSAREQIGRLPSPPEKLTSVVGDREAPRRLPFAAD